MLLQILVGAAASICNVMIHALIMAAIMNIIRTQGEKGPFGQWFLVRTMVATVTVLVAAHLMEVAVWACVYWLVDMTPAPSNLLYFAFVNYTTLGYGDIVPVENWRLLGPWAAMNGIMLFGWSTAVIFEVLRRTLKHMEDAGQ
jgi:pheromone shutdown protein TraB